MMSHEQKFDYVLKVLKDNEHRDMPTDEIINLVPEEIRSAIYFLLQDLRLNKMVISSGGAPGVTLWRITGEGKIFEGFEKKKQRMENVYNATISNTKWTKRNTYFVVASLIISFIALFLQLFQLLKKPPTH